MNRSNGFFSKYVGKSIWTSIPWQTFAFVSFLMPVLGIVLARHMLPARGPQAALAKAAVSAPDVSSTYARSLPMFQGTLSEKDLVTLHAFDESASKDIGRSPLAVETRVSRDKINPTIPGSTNQSRPKFTGHLTSILNSHGQSVAMVGGKLKRVGEVIGTGWALTSINAIEGSAIITHTSGETQVLKLRDRDKGNLMR